MVEIAGSTPAGPKYLFFGTIKNAGFVLYFMLRKRGRPFKGPTPEGVFQTVDVGSAGAEWLRQRAQKFSRRKYAAVDPYYAKPEIEFLPKNLGASGVLVRAVKISDFIDEMKAKGWRTRHFNIDMPEPFLRINDKYDFPRLFSEAEHGMLPGGQIFIYS